MVHSLGLRCRCDAPEISTSIPRPPHSLLLVSLPPFARCCGNGAASDSGAASALHSFKAAWTRFFVEQDDLFQLHSLMACVAQTAHASFCLSCTLLLQHGAFPSSWPHRTSSTQRTMPGACFVFSKLSR